MKNSILIISLIILFSLSLQAQNYCNAGGAQCGTLGVCGCYPYESPCPEESDAEILLILETDLYGWETSWEVLDETEQIIIAAGDSLQSDTTYHQLICAQTDHCYRFRIFDEGDNGLHPLQGKYTLFWNGDTIRVGGLFTTQDSVELGACCTGFQVELNGGIACSSNTYGQASVHTSGGAGPYSYTWSTGATHTEVQPIDAQNNSISVTVTDASGCTAESSLDIANADSLSVSIQQQAVSSAGAIDGSLTADPNGGIPPYSYAWSTGAGTATVDNLPAGNYTVTVTGFSGCTTVAGIDLLECIDCLESGFTVDETVVCLGESVTFSNPCTAGMQYFWEFGDGSTSDEHEPGHEYNQPGVYDVTLTVIDPTLGCTFTSTLSEPITVIPLPSAYETVNPFDCTGGTLGSITIHASGGIPPYQYSWSHDPLLIDSIATDLETGLYDCTISDISGCFINIIYTEVFTVGQIDEMVSISICDGDSIYLADDWQTEEGDYEDYYIAENGCDSVITTTLLVYDVIIPQISQSNDSLISSLANSYQWYFEGQSITSANNQVHIPEETGNYFVETIDTNGCIARSDTIFFDVVGVDEMALGNWKLRPNPTQAMVHLSFEHPELKEFTISIIDPLGRVHYHQKEAGFNGHFDQVFDLCNNASGMYFIRLESSQGVFTDRIILSK